MPRGNPTGKAPPAAWLRGMTALTLRHQRFAEEYVANGGNAGAAYRAIRPDNPDMTDMYARLRGNELRRYPLVVDYIDKLREQARKRNAVTVDRLIEELAAIALSDVRNLVECDGKTVKIKSFDDMSDDAARTISEISDSKDGPKIKMWNKLEAMAQLTKVLGIAVERREITGKGGKDLFPQEPRSDGEMARYLAHILYKGDRQVQALKAIEHEAISDEL